MLNRLSQGSDDTGCAKKMTAMFFFQPTFSAPDVAAEPWTEVNNALLRMKPKYYFTYELQKLLKNLKKSTFFLNSHFYVENFTDSNKLQHSSVAALELQK